MVGHTRHSDDSRSEADLDCSFGRKRTRLATAATDVSGVLHIATACRRDRIGTACVVHVCCCLHCDHHSYGKADHHRSWVVVQAGIQHMGACLRGLLAAVVGTLCVDVVRYSYRTTISAIGKVGDICLTSSHGRPVDNCPVPTYPAPISSGDGVRRQTIDVFRPQTRPPVTAADDAGCY